MNHTVLLRRMLLVLCLASSGVRAETLKVESIFTDHMVIQRDQPFVVQGTCEPQTKLTLELGPATVSATSDAAG